MLQQQVMSLTCDIQKHGSEELQYSQTIAANQKLIDELIVSKSSLSVSVTQLTSQVTAIKVDNEKNRVLIENLTTIR